MILKEYDPMIMILNEKVFVLIGLSFCMEKEKVSKQLLKKLKAFIKENYDFGIVLETKKVRELFPFEGEKFIYFM